jgi:hypothetical protein
MGMGMGSDVHRLRTEAEAEPAPLRGSYEDSDVTLLFTDLTGRVAPEPMGVVAELARRTAGRGHRNVVPVEPPPTDAAQALFEELLAAGSREVALLCCVLAARIAGRHPDEVALVSIARAGTPIGVIVHRLLRERYGRDSTHYSISLLPHIDVDVAALRYILRRHPPHAVRFLDGWSGKGGIARVLAAELAKTASLTGAVLEPELAVLADPGRASALCATREDVLIPSALLNATVSGLFSRSLVCDLLRAGDLHGAIRYPELTAQDCSRRFVDTVCRAAGEIGEPEVHGALAEVPGQPDFHGWSFVEGLAEEFDAPSMISFVKPGLNEACRTLVARAPALVLVDPSRGCAGLDTVVRLAHQRGVPVRERPMPYAAVGLAHG